MFNQRREVLRGIVQQRKKGTAQWKKRSAIAYCGGPGGVVAQVELFDDNSDEGGVVKGKVKWTIPLAGAKIDSLSPPSTPSDSSPQGSVVSGTSPRSGGLLSAPNPYKFEFHITSGAQQHEFKCDSEEDRVSWMKLLGLLILFPQAHIPEEPLNNPIKDFFRSKLSAMEFKADSVWPIFVLAEEVSLRLNMIGLHSLVLRGGVPNQTVGTLEIVSPADMNNPIVSWGRDKLRRTGKTGNLVFVEIGRRCKGGPGLVWLYTGVEQAQSLRETLHDFLFHGDGKAIGQHKKPIYDTPKPSVEVRSVSQPTPAPAGAYTYHTPRECAGSVGAHGGGDEYELMIHPASMNRLLYNASDYVYMHSTQSPAKYSNYDFVPPASLSTISEVERPTPYENHTLPQELRGATPVTFQPKYENVEAAKMSTDGVETLQQERSVERRIRS